MVKLSIIVPIYKVAQYLCKCVDSLLAQDIPSSEYEIILVDDGSPDECPQTCDTYADIYDNIHVVHRANGGLSAARNSGMEVAQGKYIQFVDSDDYLEPNVLSVLMQQIEKENLDVLRFAYQDVNERYEVFNPNKAPRPVDTQSGITDGINYLNTRMGYACYATQFIVRKSTSPNFTVGIHFEDVDWLPRMMLNAKRVNSTTQVVYNYLQRTGSITKTGDKTKIRKNLEDRMTVLANLSNIYQKVPTCNWLLRMRSSMTAGILMTVAREFYSERKNYIRSLRDINVFPLVIADQGKTCARRARVINILGPHIYCALMYLRKVVKN